MTITTKKQKYITKKIKQSSQEIEKKIQWQRIERLEKKIDFIMEFSSLGSVKEKSFVEGIDEWWTKLLLKHEQYIATILSFIYSLFLIILKSYFKIDMGFFYCAVPFLFSALILEWGVKYNIGWVIKWNNWGKSKNHNNENHLPKVNKFFKAAVLYSILTGFYYSALYIGELFLILIFKINKNSFITKGWYGDPIKPVLSNLLLVLPILYLSYIFGKMLVYLTDHIIKFTMSSYHPKWKLYDRSMPLTLLLGVFFPIMIIPYYISQNMEVANYDYLQITKLNPSITLMIKYYYAKRVFIINIIGFFIFWIALEISDARVTKKYNKYL